MNLSRTHRLNTTTAGLAGAVSIMLLVAACGSETGDGSTQEEAVADHEGTLPQAVDPEGREAPLDGDFTDHGVNPEVSTEEHNVSTFALDVDTGSYAVMRHYLDQGLLPDGAAIRTEEIVNYLPQDYDAPDEGLSVAVDGTAVPFLDGSERRALRVGVQAAEVEEEDRRPANLTLVVDQSGSMEGGNMDMVQSAMHALVDSLEPDDRIGIVTYSDNADLELGMTPVSEEAPLRDAIDELRPEGATNTEAGLREGYDLARENLREDGINRVVLLSDGVANRGETDPEVLAEEIAQPAGDDIQLLTVGVGMDVFNDTLLERLANLGNGFYAFVDHEQEIERLFVDDLTGTLETVALDARVQVTFDPEVVRSFRLLGYENREMDEEEFRDEEADAGELGAGHTATAVYEVVLSDEVGESAGDGLAEAEVVWRDPESGDMREAAASLDVSELAGSIGEAPPTLRQTVLAAAFAEVLRGAPWEEQVTLQGVAANVRSLAEDEPDDVTVQEFAELVRTAAEL